MITTTLAAESSAGNPILNISIFGIFLFITMAVVLRAGKTTKKASDFYTGGGTFSGRQNGLAISGDYLSAASFLGIVGAVALNGYDGFLYSVGFFVAWLVALMLVAEPMRNVGRFTMADVLSFRLKQKPVRVAASIATLFVTLFYLIAQMAGAGSLVAVLLDIHDFKAGGRRGRRWCAHDCLCSGRRHEGHHLRADDQGRTAGSRCGHHVLLGIHCTARRF